MPNAIENAKTILSELGNILEAVDIEQTENLADAILAVKSSNKKIYAAGAGRSLLMIRGFAMRMMHLGLNSYVVGETSTPAIQTDDLIVFGSGSGETGALTIMIKKAKSVGAKVAVITCNPDSTLGRQADILVQIPIEKGIKGFQPSGSTFEQGMLILCDALVLRILEKGGLPKGFHDIDKYIMRFHANLE
jgi:6-phospho-3-hexuloisomerase